MKIAAQLYTLRDFLKTPEDIENSLKKVKEIGYDAVQVSGMGSIDPEDLKRIVDREGLTICATHIAFDRLKDDIDRVIEEHQLWDCKYVGLGAMPEEYRKNKDGFLQFIREASIIASKLKENGLQFIYHNHNFEFTTYEDQTGMEILLENTDPGTFNFEIDTYWVQAGGGDPAQWIRNVAGRMEVVHFKDMTVSGWDSIMAEVGEGNLNWERIIQACKDIGVLWVCVEQDICQRDPFESLAISLKNLQELGV